MDSVWRFSEKRSLPSSRISEFRSDDSHDFNFRPDTAYDYVDEIGFSVDVVKGDDWGSKARSTRWHGLCDMCWCTWSGRSWLFNKWVLKVQQPLSSRKSGTVSNNAGSAYDGISPSGFAIQSRTNTSRNSYPNLHVRLWKMEGKFILKPKLILVKWHGKWRAEGQIHVLSRSVITLSSLGNR